MGIFSATHRDTAENIIRNCDKSNHVINKHYFLGFSKKSINEILSSVFMVKNCWNTLQQMEMIVQKSTDIIISSAVIPVKFIPGHPAKSVEISKKLSR